jgi:hypothetical protein
MATRGTQFGRTMTYFREAHLDEAQAALNRAAGIVNERTAQAQTTQKPQRRARKAKGNAVEPATQERGAVAS